MNEGAEISPYGITHLRQEFKMANQIVVAMQAIWNRSTGLCFANITTIEIHSTCSTPIMPSATLETYLQ